jgi:uncharacterized protein DUF4012
MDDRRNPPPEPRKGLLSGQYADSGGRPPARDQPAQTGGLLSRFGGDSESAPPEREEGGWHGLAGGARRMGENLRRMTEGALRRAPRHGDWRATDFSPHEIAEWDRRGEVPFEVPRDPDAPGWDKDDAYDDEDDGDYSARGPRAYAGGRGTRDLRDEWDEQVSRARKAPRGERDAWDDAEWNAADAGDWDTAWGEGGEVDWDNAQWDDERGGWDYQGEGRQSRSRGGWDARDGRDGGGRGWDEPAAADAGWDVVDDLRGSLDAGVLSESMSTLAQLGAVSRPMTRMARIRLLMRRRPAAAAMLAFFLLSFMLMCCAPLVPLIRLGYDVSDLTHRVQNLQALSAGGVTSLINVSNIKQAQQDIAAIESDLYEINGAVSVVGAPAGAVSPAARNYQLLVRIGYDLTGAANESLQIAQLLVTPLEGGALSADSATPGIQPADIEQARVLLSDAFARAQDAISAYNQLDQRALPAQLKPGSKYGGYLAQLPLVVKVFAEMKDLIDAAPALLGVGQPAYYLAVALDNSELRPGGGFQGNYGLLELDGGKQSKTNPFGLKNTYLLDQQYALKNAPNPMPAWCPHQVTMPTNLYWWWPYRCIKDFGWGLRDSNLSADFPTNARLAMQIVEAGGGTPNGAPIQGVVAFTPGLIQKILEVTGDLRMPTYGITVTPATLVQDIHHFQLDPGATKGKDRKEFTHDLAKALLDRIKGLHGSGLKVIFKIAADSIQSKDLQVYLADPRAELVLRQLGIDSAVATGQGDGFFVVDTNDGGNKANLYVTETQTDLVTLLPDGGAFHRLAISVTYDKKHSIYNPGSTFDDYSDIQRTYMPGDATLVGWSGFAPTLFNPGGCGGSYASVITDCTPDHGIFTPSTASDTPGRTMLMGSLLVMCGAIPQENIGAYDSGPEYQACETSPQPHTQTIFISWYTPHAYTIGTDGHGTYSELVEKQAGGVTHLTVYITRGSLPQHQKIIDLDTFTAQASRMQKIFDGALAQNQVVHFSF